jgi:hypothetical protein
MAVMTGPTPCRDRPRREPAVRRGRAGALGGPHPLRPKGLGAAAQRPLGRTARRVASSSTAASSALGTPGASCWPEASRAARRRHRSCRTTSASPVTGARASQSSAIALRTVAVVRPPLAVVGAGGPRSGCSPLPLRSLLDREGPQTDGEVDRFAAPALGVGLRPPRRLRRRARGSALRQGLQDTATTGPDGTVVIPRAASPTCRAEQPGPIDGSRSEGSRRSSACGPALRAAAHELAAPTPRLAARRR